MTGQTWRAIKAISSSLFINISLGVGSLWKAISYSTLSSSPWPNFLQLVDVTILLMPRQNSYSLESHRRYKKKREKCEQYYSAEKPHHKKKGKAKSQQGHTRADTTYPSCWWCRTGKCQWLWLWFTRQPARRSAARIDALRFIKTRGAFLMYRMALSIGHKQNLSRQQSSPRYRRI